MADLNVSTIGSGQDYSTIQAWEDAAPANLVTSDEVWMGVIMDASVFNEQVTFAGSTTDATRYKFLTVDPSVRHDGTGGNGARSIYSGTGHSIITSEDHVRIEWLSMSRSGTPNNSDELIRVASPGDSRQGVRIGYCLFYDISHQDGDCVYLSGDNHGNSTVIEVYSSMAWNVGRGMVHVQDDGASATDVHVECTSLSALDLGLSMTDESQHGLGIGFSNTTGGKDHSSSVITCYNCFIDYDGAQRGAFYTPATTNGTIDGDYNASNDTTSPGANSVDSLTPSNEFEDVGAGTEDLHLKSTSNIIGDGRKPGGDADRDAHPGGIDIDGYDRDDPLGGEPWDIGADQQGKTNDDNGPPFDRHDIGRGVMVTM